MRNFTRSFAFILLILICRTSSFAQQIQPYSGTFITTDSVQLTWIAGLATSYTLTIDDGTTKRDVVLTSNNYWLKGYQPFDTINLKLSGYNSGGLLYKTNSVLYTANFASHPKLCLWLDPSTVDTLAGGIITQWRDKSKRGFVFTQPATASRPLLKNYAGVKSVNFTTDFLSCSNFYDVDSMKSTFVMLRHDGLTTGNYGMFLSKAYDKTGSYTLTKNDGVARNYIVGNNYSTNVPIDNNWQILSYIYRADKSFTTERNFSQSHIQTLSGALTGTNAYPLTIGRDAANNSYFYGGDVSEIIVFSESLSNVMNIYIKKYLSSRYAPPAVPQVITVNDRFCDKTLSLPTAYRSYLWSTGSTASTITVNASGKYTVTVQNAFSDSFIDTLTVNYPEIALRDTFYCSFDSVQLTTGLDPSKFDFSWSNGQTTQVVWIKNTGTYSVTVKDKYGCSRLSPSIIVSENNFPRNDMFTKDTLLCTNNKLKPAIQNRSLHHYLWSNGTTDSCTLVDKTGKYKLTVTESTGCKAIDSVNVSIRGIAPIVNFASDTVCLGIVTTFSDKSSSVDPIASYSWDFSDGTTSSIQHSQHKYDNPGTKAVTLEVATATGCRESLRKNAIVGEIPQSAFNLTNGPYWCLTNNLALTNNSHTVRDVITAQNWDFGNGNTSATTVPSYTYPEAGDYSLKLTNTTEYNCVSSVTVPISVVRCNMTAFTPQILPYSGTFVSTDSVKLTWSAGLATSYTLTIDDGTVKRDVTLTNNSYWLKGYQPFDTINLKLSGYNTGGLLYKTNSVLYTANFASHPKLCLWLDPSTVDTLAGGIVTQWRDKSKRGFVFTQPAAASRPLLKNNSGVRSVNFTTDFLFSNFYDVDSMKATFVVLKHDGLTSGNYGMFLSKTWDNASSYTLTKTDGVARNYIVGNNYSTTVAIDNNWQILSYIYRQDKSFTTEQNFTQSHIQTITGAFTGTNTFPLTIGKDAASTGYSYGGDISEIIIFSESLSITNNIFVKKYLSSRYSPNDPPQIVAVDDNFCSKTLSLPSKYSSYKWSTGSTNPTTTVNFPGKYTVTVQNSFGDSFIDTITVKYPEIALRDTFYCSFDSVMLTTGLDPVKFTFSWSNGKTTPTVWIKKAGYYSVLIKDKFGCSRLSPTITISENNFPRTDLFQQDTVLCVNNKLKPEVPNRPLHHYLWSNGTTDSCTFIDKAGKYKLTVTESTGCKAIDSVNVSIKGNLPNISFISDIVCLGNATSFTEKSSLADAVASYSWDFSDGSVSNQQHPQHTYSSPGEKAVTLEIATTTGCKESLVKNAVVGEIPVPAFTVTSGNFGCTAKNIAITNESHTVNDAITAQKWEFGTGETSTLAVPKYTYPVSGDYSLKLTTTTEYNCKNSLTVPVSIYIPAGSPCVPQLAFPLNDTALINQSLRLRWTNTCNSFQQKVQVSATSNFSTLLVDSIIPANSISLAISLPFGKYWWRVYNLNNCKDSAVSSIGNFTVFKPEMISDIRLWLDAGRGVETDIYGNVAVWHDLAPAGKNVRQDVVIQRPAYVEKVLNGLPAVRFDGANDFLVGQNLYADDHNVSIFIVHKFDGKRPAYYQTLLSQNGDNGIKYRIFTYPNTKFKTSFGNQNNSLIGLVESGSDYFNLSSTVSSAQTDMFSNGKTNASATLFNYVGMETEFVIGTYASNNLTQVFSGDIAEIIIFNRALNADEQKKIDTYLLAKYQPEPIELGADRNIPYRLCPEELALTAGYSKYQWNTGELASKISTIDPGRYSATVTSAFGINSSDSLYINRPKFHCGDTSICYGGQLKITPGPSGNYSYLWSTGATSPTFLSASTGIYSLTITDTTGCSRSFDDFSIAVDSFPITASLGLPKRTLCHGQQIGLVTGINEAIRYQWSDSSVSPLYTISKSEKVTVTVTDKWSCQALDTVQVKLQGYPIATDFSVANTCYQDVTEFVSTSSPYDSIAKLQWTVDGIAASQSPIYKTKLEQQGNRVVSLKATSVSNCVSSKTDTIFIKPKPTADFPIGDACTSGAYRYVNNSTAGKFSSLATASWNINGEKTSTKDAVYHQFATVGTKNISLSVTNSHGCSDQISKTQTVVHNSFAPGNFNLTAPVHNSIIMDSIVTFRWESSTNGYRYILQMSRTADFATIEYTDSSYTNRLNVPVQLAGDHFWRIQAINICGNATYSGINRLQRINLNTQANVALWLKADAGITFTGDSAVSVWADQSAKKNNVTQTVLACQPVFKPAAINGKPAITFDGTTDQLKTAATLGVSASNMSIFVISKFNENKSTNLNTILSQRTSTGVKFSLYAPSNTNNALTYGNYPPETEPIATMPYGMGDYKISSLVANKDSTFIYTNSLLSAKGKTQIPTGTDNIFIVGGMLYANSSTYNLSGEIAEIIIFNSALSHNEQVQVENYLFNKYSTPLELGSNISYSLCQKEIVAPDVYKTYLWNTKVTGKKTSLTGPGTYSLTVTDQLGKTWIDSVVVSRPFPNNLHDSLFCAKDTVLWNLNMPGDYKFLWSDGSSEPFNKIYQDKTLSAKITDTLGCSINSDTVSFTADNFPTESSIGSDRSLCAGEYIFFENEKEPASKYQWASGSSLIYDIAKTSGKYSVTATNANGCVFSNSINVNVVGQAPEITVAIPDICQNISQPYSAEIKTLTGDPVKSVSWKFGSTDIRPNNPANYSFTKSGLSSVTVNAETTNGCKATYYANINVKPNPAATIVTSFGQTHCIGSPVLFTAKPEAASSMSGYSWSFGKTGISAKNTFSAEGKYPIGLVATNLNGCQWSAIDTVTVKSSLPSTVAVALLSPANKDVILDTVPKFVWTAAANVKYYVLKVTGADGVVNKADSLTVNQYSIKIKTSQKYTWQVLSIGYCGDTLKSPVFSFDKTDIRIMNPTLWLDASDLTLQPGQFITKWGKTGTTPVTQSDVQLSPSLFKASTAAKSRNGAFFDGTGYLSGPTDFGMDKMVTLSALVRIDSTAKLGMIISKGYSGEGCYSVSVAANTNKLTLYVDGTTTTTANSFYGWVLLTIQHKQDSLLMYVDNKLEIASRTLRDNKGTNTYPLTIGRSSQSDTYYFNGAVAEMLGFGTFLTPAQRSVINKYLYTKYLPSLVLPADSVTTGFYPITLKAPSAYRNYSWSNAATKRDITVNSSSNYKLTVTDMLGNKLIDSCRITYPFVNQINDTSICLGSSIVWDPKLTGEYQFDWYKNENPLEGTTDKLTISNAGTYQLFVTDKHGYSWSSKKVTISVIDLTGSLDLGADKTVCKYELLEPVRHPDNIKSYIWANGATLPYTYALESRTYYLTVSDLHGCSVTDSIGVSVKGEAPTATLSLADLCENMESRFAPTINGSIIVAKYSWKIADETYFTDTVKAFFAPSPQIPIRLSLESVASCKTVIFDTIAVLPVIGKTITVFPGTENCIGSSFTATTQPQSVTSYSWTDSEGKNVGTSAAFKPIFGQAGKYTLQLSAQLDNGCVVPANVAVTVNADMPVADKPVLTYPANNLRIFDKTVRFGWNEKKAAYYQLQVAYDLNFTQLVASVDSILAQQFAVSLTKDSAYFWRVIAHNYCGGTVVSQVNRFDRFSIEAFKPVVWINASNISATDQSTISHWGEPATHTFAQTDATRQPLYHQKNAAIGNMPSVEFANKAYMAGDTLLPLDSMQTVIGLVENSMLGSYGMIISKQYGANGSFTLAKNTGNTQFRMYVDGGNVLNKKFCPGWSLVCFSMGKDTVYSYFDNEADAKQVFATDFKGRNNSPITIGKNSDGDSYHFSGKIAELMVLPGRINTLDYQLLATYFINKYQPEINLPDTITLPGFRTEQLSVSSGFRSYEWSTGSTDSTITIAGAGTYSLTATDYLGRQITDKTVVIAPSANDLADSVLCIGENTVWDSKLSTPFSFVWYKNGEQLGSHASSLRISAEGAYQLQVIDEFGYSQWSRVRNVTIRDIAADINLGNDTTLCENVNFYPKSLPDHIATYLWSNGMNTPYLKIAEAGKYHLSVTDIYGCSADDSIAIAVEGLAADISIVPQPVCEDAETELNNFVPNFAATGVTKYQWQVGDSLLTVSNHLFTAQSSAVLPIKLTTFSDNGCNNVAAADLAVLRVPDFGVSIFPSAVNCISQKYVLRHIYKDTIGIATYSWDNTQNSLASATSVYQPQFTNEGSVSAHIKTLYANGCSLSKSMPLTVIASSDVVETQPTLITPVDGETIYADSVAVKWQDNGASFYSVVLAKDKLMSDIIVQIDSLQSTSHVFRVKTDGDIYISVRAHFLCGTELLSTPIRVMKYNLLSSNTILWLNAGDLKLFEGAPVQNWGAGKNKLFQSDPNTAPRLQRSNFDIAGQPAVHISDQRFMEGMATMPLDSIRTVFMLADIPATGSYQMILSKGYSGEGAFTIAKDNGNTKIKVYTDGASTASRAGYSGWNLLCLQINGKKAKLYVNGVLDSEMDLGKNLSGRNDAPLTIGKNGGDASYHYTGNIAELFIFKNIVTDSEREIITKYFADKYTAPLQLQDSLVVSYGFCPAELSPLTGFKRYRWSSGDTSAAIIPRKTGYYRLTATDFMGRVYTDSTYVMLMPVPVLADTAFCFHGAISLNADMGSDYLYQWSTGSADASIQVNATGKYAVTISDMLGCNKVLGPIAVDIDFFAQEASLGADRALCEGNRIGLVQRSVGATDFLWSDGSTEPTLPITQSGSVSLWAKNNRGCEMRDTIVVSISGTAPTAGFSIDGHCQGMPVTFSSQATSTDTPISSYQWIIADKTYSGQILSQAFSKPGTFAAKHIVSKSDGCTDSSVVKFDIDPTPSADFLPLQGCEGQTIRFRPVDVQNSNVIAQYKWINGNEQSDAVQPEYQFDTTGLFPVTLIAVGDSGCTDTTRHDVLIKQGVSPRFIHTPACQGAASAFFNKTELSSIQQITEEKWIIDDTAFNSTGNFEYLFNKAGTYKVGLSLKTVNGCSNTFTENIVVTAAPKAFFRTHNGCEHDSVALSCDSISPRNVKYSAQWSIDGAELAGTKPQFVQDSAGTYLAKLSVTTEFGCSALDSAEVQIFTRPEASFTHNDTAQIMPFSFELRNLSRNADSTVWIFNNTDTVRTADAQLRIKDTAALDIQLIALTDKGCRDSVSKRIGFVSGFRKLVAENVFAYSQEGYSKTLFVVKNNGTAPIESINFYIEIDNTHFIKEQWNGTLSAGDTLQYLYRGTIKEQSAASRKVCVYAATEERSGNAAFTDTLCTSLDQAFGVLPLYPNPSRDNLTVDYSVPSAGTVTFDIESASGMNVATWSRTVVQGYNLERIEISALSAGTYTLRIRFGKETRREQFVKLK